MTCMLWCTASGAAPPSPPPLLPLEPDPKCPTRDALEPGGGDLGGLSSPDLGLVSLDLSLIGQILKLLFSLCVHPSPIFSDHARVGEHVRGPFHGGVPLVKLTDAQRRVACTQDEPFGGGWSMFLDFFAT